MRRDSRAHWLAGGLAALLMGCSTQHVRIESQALPRSTPAFSDRYIVAAVANTPEPLTARAGNTPRAYEAITNYSATFTARTLMHRIAKEYGLTEVQNWPIEPLRLHCAVLELPAKGDRAAVLAGLAHDSRVRLAQPLQDFQTRSDYNDPYVGLQRGFQAMNVAAAHPWSTGEGIRVAVIDTGADVEHPDLAASIEQAQNFVDGDAGQFRRDRHGTEIAGVIAAVANNAIGIVGIAPASRLLILKACWQLAPGTDAARCNSFTLARALAAALAAHAQVVNLSLTGPKDPLLGELIRAGVDRGIVFVGAASQQPGGLSSEPGLIEVASSESEAVTAPGRVYAPGQEILTLLPGGHYDFASGESLSTAEVTGVVALLLARDRALTPALAARLLHETSAPGRAGQAEHVDACAALGALLRRGGCEHGEIGLQSNPSQTALETPH